MCFTGHACRYENLRGECTIPSHTSPHHYPSDAWCMDGETSNLVKEANYERRNEYEQRDEQWQGD